MLKAKTSSLVKEIRRNIPPVASVIDLRVAGSSSAKTIFWLLSLINPPPCKGIGVGVVDPTPRIDIVELPLKATTLLVADWAIPSVNMRILPFGLPASLSTCFASATAASMLLPAMGIILGLNALKSDSMVFASSVNGLTV